VKLRKLCPEYLPDLLIVVAVFGLWLHGPISQLPHYNDFADQRTLLGITNGANVLSNVGFAAVGLWGLCRLWPVRRQQQLAKGWVGYYLFLISLVLTSLVAAVLSVAWWYVTEQSGQGDLGPYLLLQGLPLLLIPLWQALHGAPRTDRLAFGTAIALYALAKVAELQDEEVLNAVGWISGHTIKHLLATASAAVIVGRLVWRTRQERLP
jgi:hypothetical protein